MTQQETREDELFISFQVTLYDKTSGRIRSLTFSIQKTGNTGQDTEKVNHLRSLCKQYGDVQWQTGSGWHQGKDAYTPLIHALLYCFQFFDFNKHQNEENFDEELLHEPRDEDILEDFSEWKEILTKRIFQKILQPDEPLTPVCYDEAQLLSLFTYDGNVYPRIISGQGLML